jgi:23S rRNA pseudouridine1911/1915/1917 synthase
MVPEAIPLKIIHEDGTLVVVDKPAGLVVHPGTGNRQGTLANALLHHFQSISRSETIRPGIVHRLDKATSGLMVVAKNDQAHDFLARQFKDRQVEKHYLALVYGCLKERAGVIDVSLGRDPFVRTKMSTRSRRARKALTRYETIRVYRDFTYVRVYPQTGRTHQIRVHFQHLGHPVVGDETYGGKAIQRVKDPDLIAPIRSLKRYFLHAEFLAFVHPDSGEKVSFEIPLPDELAELLRALK